METSTHHTLCHTDAGAQVNYHVSANSSSHLPAMSPYHAIHVRAAPKNDTIEFVNLCLSLARGIDFSISNQEVPSRAKDLPSLLKQVCQCKNDAVVQAAVMVLMISVKSACESGWFSERDSEELQNLAKEIACNFCSVSNFNTEPTSSLPVISTIMSRFYPTMKMGHIFAFLEIQPGYGTYVRDFQISKNAKFSREDKIRLFVVQADSIETSSCLISPPKVNFLLNGKGVERRTNLYTDTGPQIPTLVTHMLKYGSNLLQAVGDFNGNYIIAVAFMSAISTPNINVLQDYVQHVPATTDSDSEIIEGASRISINCPISFTRIKTPVKGHSCKHLQCFDFDNYVDINSRRPSWRCPHCNQHVCFTDIRLDQNMAKVLKEVGPNATEVIISSDGSWNAVMETDDATKKPEDKTSNVGHDASSEIESAGLADAPVEILDLTEIDDVIDGVATRESEDRKLSPTTRQSLSMTKTPSVNPQMANTNDVNQNIAQIEDEFWSGIYLSTFGTGTSNVRSNPPIAGVSNQELEVFHGNVPLATSVPESETALPNNLQLQQYQFGNPNMSNEYGRLPSISSHVTRTPIAIQALPAQTPTSILQQRSRNCTNTFMQDSPSAASQASPSTRLVPNGFSTLHSTPSQVSQMPSSSLQQYSVIQQNRSVPSVRPSQHNIGLQTPNQVPNAYRVSNERQSSSPLQMANLAASHAMNQSFGQVQSSIQPSANFLGPQMHGVGSQIGVDRSTGIVGSQQPRLMIPNQRNGQMARPVETSRAHPYSLNADARRMPSVAHQIENTGGTSLPGTRTDAYDQADQNWRPTARMRGALSGQAYSDAFNQFILRPTMQPQAARPISNAGSLPGNVPAPLQVPLMADRVALGPQLPNYPSRGQASRPRVSGVSPEGSSGN
ncbi:E4 SUMO-protein ligase PIAL2-like [Forsythia ovata]|uniref:E4 SUMO-protein ligase PIAL2-like n=1 Tax=Forsythia ovata TaxID=205694 RepID=A0ABD1W3L8_9LAMI